jgi:hypothetical protein
VLGLNWNRRDWRFCKAIDRAILGAYQDVIERSGAVLAVLLVLATQAHATEIEPRAYVNTPVGINFLVMGYAYSDGGLSTAASSPIKDAKLKIHTSVLAYARSLDVWGKCRIPIYQEAPWWRGNRENGISPGCTTRASVSRSICMALPRCH